MTLEQIIKSSVTIAPKHKAVLNIMYSSRVVEEKIAGILKPFGISKEQYNVLRILRGQKGKPANLFTIQERMVHKMSNTTRLVDKLIDKGLAERATCETNRRKVEIGITPKGLQLLEEIEPKMLEGNEEMTKKFSIEELQLLNNLLDKIR
jgi:DNA-binding MarR family transcriptional regulator